jgi:hypothetical protein
VNEWYNEAAAGLRDVLRRRIPRIDAGRVSGEPMSGVEESRQAIILITGRVGSFLLRAFSEIV